MDSYKKIVIDVNTVNDLGLIVTIFQNYRPN